MTPILDSPSLAWLAADTPPPPTLTTHGPPPPTATWGWGKGGVCDRGWGRGLAAVRLGIGGIRDRVGEGGGGRSRVRGGGVSVANRAREWGCPRLARRGRGQSEMAISVIAWD